MKTSAWIFISCLNFVVAAQAADFNKVSTLADKNQTSQALTELNQLAQKKQISSELEIMTRARLLFQRGDLKSALAQYERIPKSSEYWFEAIEERAHTMGRAGRYAEALSLLESVLAEPFHHLTGPEPYFVAALTHLRICNYSEVLKTSQSFKNRFQQRMTSLTQIASGKSTRELDLIRETLKSEPVSFSVIGKHIARVPRHLHRDRLFINNPKTLNLRAQALAKIELKEINQIITKLQIIEAEVIQRIHIAEAEGDRVKSDKIPSGSDLMVFPKDDDIWIDEIGSYATQVEKCPSAKTPTKSQVSL